MPDSNPFDMDLDGDVDGIDFLGFDCFMRHGPGRAGVSEQGPADTGAPTLATLIGLAVLAVTLLFGCLMCTLAVFSAS